MVRRKAISKGDRHSKAIQPSHSPVVGGAVNMGGEVQTVSDMMPIRRCSEMILLAFK